MPNCGNWVFIVALWRISASGLILILGMASAVAGPIDDFNNGLRLSQTGDFKGAIRLYTKAIESRQMKPAHLAEAYYSRALSYDRLRRTKLALDDYLAAVSFDPGMVAAWSSICFDRIQLNQLDVALAACDKALSLDPKHAPTFSIRAEYWEKKGKLNKAEKDYSRAIEFDPKNWFALMNRGNFYADLGRDASARRDIERAYRIAPDWASKNPRSQRFSESTG